MIESLPDHAKLPLDAVAGRGDDAIARAMNSVLESESAARAAVAECERSCAEVLEQARQQRRSILDRAQSRIVALHARAARRLEIQAADLTEQRRKAAALMAEQLSDPARRRTAIERLAARLTAIAPTD